MSILIPVDVTDFLCRTGHLSVTTQIIKEHEATVEIDTLQNIVGNQRFHERISILAFLKLIIAVSYESIPFQ
jgi:hypothetical protein